MRLLVGIPVHNEVGYIDRVLAEVQHYCREIFVVDDGSTDGTAARLAAWPAVVVHTHQVNEGYGQSIIDIFDYAGREGYDWVVTLDADEQHEPRAIADFERAAAEGLADVISGSRYLEHSVKDGVAPDDRRWINCQITDLLRSLTGYPLTDSFCGFKAYRVSALGRLQLTDRGYAMPLQFWIQAHRQGLTVVEIPVKLIYKDPNRKFGGGLDNSELRLRHYLDVISREVGRQLECLCDGRKVECPCR